MCADLVDVPITRLPFFTSVVYVKISMSIGVLNTLAISSSLLPASFIMR